MHLMLNSKFAKLGFLVVSAVFVLAPMALAAPTPDLYPNKHLKNVGPDQARRDARQCRVLAEDYLEQNAQRGAGARGLLRKSAKGAAFGALAGAITKNNAGRSAGAGAAILGANELLNQRKVKLEGSPEYKKYVEACLEDKGYKVVGWKR